MSQPGARSGGAEAWEMEKNPGHGPLALLLPEHEGARAEEPCPTADGAGHSESLRCVKRSSQKDLSLLELMD